MYNKAFNTTATRMGARKAAPGIVGKESSLNAPPAPTHRIPASHGTPAAAVPRYDRYEAVTAW